ncbi:phosphatidylserine decarboxylase [Cladophialophora carrionii CBS 160.54]|uniref:phosphatidylserine decarboxylase n=1 Tax=Cladophialophora carrionii CBS 160.54 TaxID=1279043 RepID=V9DQQ4_9EURO|nr:phosphatidylserine decarboxylase [Cladophialophora carrionii CBS 160.54]ETI29239.1 phosphatidylserine decarboxylase [Cladophialophora carrionii CBS 160.54]
MGAVLSYVHSILDNALTTVKLVQNREVGWKTLNRKTGRYERERQPIYKKIKLWLLFSWPMEWIDRTWLLRHWIHDKTIRSGKKEGTLASASQIQSFVDFYHINMDDFSPSDIHAYRTFEDFFVRQHKPGARPIFEEDDPSRAVVVADCRLVVYPTVAESKRLWIKGRNFTIGNLIEDDATARTWHNGAIASFRLSPQDYHRYHSPVEGVVEWYKQIPGEYYQVDPLCVRSDIDILTLNARCAVCINSPLFGRVLFVAIGATNVGTVEINPKCRTKGSHLRKGEEVGLFQFGGSSIIVAFEEGKIRFDEDLLSTYTTVSVFRLGDASSLDAASPARQSAPIMTLPKPNASFKIPSVHDDTELDCRIYYPRKTEKNSRAFGRSFAIVAHPYAPLGGCYDDPVVALVGGVLLQQGFVLATFNFRGASGSSGRTSWSGKPELSDYVSVYGFLLHYIDAIFRAGAEEQRCRYPPPLLILGGYSYGSMIASHLPPIDLVVELFKLETPDSAGTEIKRRAEELSRDARAYFDMYSASTTLTVAGSPGTPRGQIRKTKPGVIMGGYESGRISRENSRKSIDTERIRQSLDRVRRKIGSQADSPSTPSSSASVTEAATSPLAEPAPTVLPDVAYLIVSPILSMAASFTTMFSKLRFVAKGLQGASASEGEFHQLTVHPCCCLYGNKDVFTSARKLQRWTEELKARPGSRFMAVEADAGHFWREADGIVRFKQGLCEFLETLTSRRAASTEDDARS